MATIDAGEFRTGQRDQWNTASTGWKKWSELIDRAAMPVSDRLVELAEITPGDRVLDIACGYGEPSLTAAKLCGPEGEVVASDISAGMLAYGRERAAERGLENVQFVESDASSLDFAEGSFDAALSRWGIIFEPEPERTAEKIRGFLKPGGRMAISSWGPPDKAVMFGLTMGTLVRTLGITPPPPGSPGPLARPTPDALAALLEGGGFSNVQTEEIDVVFDVESPEQFVTYMREIAPPITAALSQFPEDVQQKGWAAILEATREYAGGDKPFGLSNQALLAVGEA